MQEDRNAPRTATKTQGTAILGDQRRLDCAIRDLSATGAKLSFRQPTFLPKTFRLSFDSEDQRVSVVWQRGLHAGVRFQTPIRRVTPPKKKKGLLGLLSKG
jgi:hypothetical protein